MEVVISGGRERNVDGNCFFNRDLYRVWLKGGPQVFESKARQKW